MELTPHSNWSSAGQRCKSCSRECRGGARGRSRTDTLLRAADFLTASAFAAPDRRRSGSWSGARLHHSLAAVGARRLLSTPSRGVSPGLGSALARTDELSRASTDFDGLHLGDFSARAQVVLSESAASTNSATRATSACRTPIRARGGRIIEGRPLRRYGVDGPAPTARTAGRARGVAWGDMACGGVAWRGATRRGRRVTCARATPGLFI